MMADENRTNPQPAIPLGYELPQPNTAKVGATIVLVTLFICGASVGLFAIEAESRYHMYSGGQHPDSWPAAMAVVALSAMGTGFGYFLTRRR